MCIRAPILAYVLRKYGVIRCVHFTVFLCTYTLRIATLENLISHSYGVALALPRGVLATTPLNYPPEFSILALGAEMHVHLCTPPGYAFDRGISKSKSHSVCVCR